MVSASSCCRSRASSAKRQYVSDPRHDAAKKTACMAAQTHGLTCAAAWLYTASGATVPTTPCSTRTYPTPSPNGSQSSYSAITGTITKKWKWASIRPPVAWTRRLEHITSPVAVIAARTVRGKRFVAPSGDDRDQGAVRESAPGAGSEHQAQRRQADGVCPEQGEYPAVTPLPVTQRQRLSVRQGRRERGTHRAGHRIPPVAQATGRTR